MSQRTRPTILDVERKAAVSASFVAHVRQQVLRVVDARQRVRLNDFVSPPLAEAALRNLKRAEGWNTPGADGQRLQLLTPKQLSTFINTVVTNLLLDRYMPQPLRLVSIPKSGGGSRTLSIPTPSDKLVQHVVAIPMLPVIERHLRPCVYGGRLGRSRDLVFEDFMSWAARLNPSVELHFVKLDIRACFDRIQHHHVWPALDRLFFRDFTMSALRYQLVDWALSPGCGVPQGAPLSPMLCNVALSPIDDVLATGPFSFAARYLDDILIAVVGPRAAAEHYLGMVKARLAGLELESSPHKTMITTSEEGCEFLGVRLFRRSGRFMTSVAPKSLNEKLAFIDETIAVLKAQGFGASRTEPTCDRWT